MGSLRPTDGRVCAATPIHAYMYDLVVLLFVLGASILISVEAGDRINILCCFVKLTLLLYQLNCMLVCLPTLRFVISNEILHYLYSC
jgi:hypothetical protein